MWLFPFSIVLFSMLQDKIQAFSFHQIKSLFKIPCKRIDAETINQGMTKLPFEFSKGFVTAITAASLLVGYPIPSPAQEQVLQANSVVYGKSAVSLQTAESQLMQLFEQSTSSVVNINTFVSQINVYSMNVIEVPQGTGSGFIWDSDGHIVTNFHVIRNANAAKVTLLGPNGITTTYSARVQGIDPDKDIAILNIDITDSEVRKSLKPISVGSSSNLRVGQTVLAIGNPFGLDHTLTTGA